MRPLTSSILFLALLAPLAAAETLEQAVERYVVAAGTDSPWEVTGSVGVTYATGNTDQITAALAIDASKGWDPWKLSLKWRSIYGESDGDENANEHILIQRLERALDEKSSLFEQLLLEHDEQERLNLRAQLTLGYRRQLVKQDKFELNGEIGAGVLYEDFRGETDTEFIAHLGVDWKWQITDKVLYTQVITLYPSLSEFGEFRLYWESVFTTPISEQLDLRLALTDKYDSAAPAGVENNDFQAVLGIQIRFTKKKAA